MSPFEQLNRQRKVAALAARIWADMSSAQRNDPDTPWQVSQADAAWWKAAAGQAGVNAPSEISRRAVVAELCKAVNMARRFERKPCEMCGGTGEVGSRFVPGTTVECRDCRGTGVELCDHCDEEAAQVSVPLGFYGRACARAVFPEIPQGVVRGRPGEPDRPAVAVSGRAS